MTNVRPGNNGSQFFICIAKTEWLDGKHAVFGQVVSLRLWLNGKPAVFGQAVEGMDVVRAIEKVECGSGKTSKPVVVADCGQLCSLTVFGFCYLVMNC